MTEITLASIGLNKPFKLDNGEIYTSKNLTKGDKIRAISLNNEQCFFNRNIKATAIANPRDDQYI